MIEIAGYVVLGLAAGIIAATLGVGGGIVFVPALVVFFEFAQHDAQGTSLAVIVPTAVVGAAVHAGRGRVDWRVAGLVSIGGLAGGLVGSSLALAMDPIVLQRVFAALLVVIAARLLSS